MVVNVKIPKQIFGYDIGKGYINESMDSIHIESKEVCVTNSKTLFLAECENTEVNKLPKSFFKSGLNIPFKEIVNLVKPLSKYKKLDFLDFSIEIAKQDLQETLDNEYDDRKLRAKVKFLQGCNVAFMDLRKNYVDYSEAVNDGFMAKRAFELDSKFLQLRYFNGIKYLRLQGMDSNLYIGAGIKGEATLPKKDNDLFCANLECNNKNSIVENGEVCIIGLGNNNFNGLDLNMPFKIHLRADKNLERNNLALTQGIYKSVECVVLL